MGQRKLLIAVLCATEIALAALVLIVPVTLFPVCEPPMHCHYSLMAEAGLAAVVVLSAALSILSKGPEAKRMLSAVTFVCGIFMILYPSYLIGVCASPMMACHYGALPVWNLAGALLSLISTAVFFAAGEGRA